MIANVLSTQITSAAVVVYGLQRLKAAKWFPLLEERSQVWVKRGASALAALGVHTGISYAWNEGAHGAHVLILTIPSAAVLIVGLWHWGQQFVLQELIYQTTAKDGDGPAAVPPAARK